MKWIKTSILGFLLFLSLLLTVVDLVAFDPKLFQSSYQRENTMATLNMSEQDLMRSSNVLLDYLKGKRKDIMVEAEVNGHKRMVFNKRETKHMVDVKKLYEKAMLTRNVCVILMIVGMLVEFSRNRAGMKTFLWEVFRNGLLVFGFLLLFLSVYAITDFYGFWMNFHYLFFDNDLFLLDPNVSLMINMFPESFFFRMVMRIVIMFAVVSLTIGGVVYDLFGRRRSVIA